MTTGRLLGVGVGPGDPELLTLKAVRILREGPVIAYVSAGGRPSIARSIVAEHLSPGWPEIHIVLPMRLVPELAHAAYDEGAARIGAVLERGRDVAVLCVGDPFVYGSFAQLFERLGTPELAVVQARAPDCLAGQPAPDAVFVGGGIGEPALLETCWQMLGPGGRLVANVVTAEGEQRLLAWQAANGGELVRIEVARLDALGSYRAWRPSLPVTQLAAHKP